MFVAPLFNFHGGCSDHGGNDGCHGDYSTKYKNGGLQPALFDITNPCISGWGCTKDT